MHHANHFYGHAHILARYCGHGPDRPPRIRGYLQHGWNVGDGLAPGTRFVRGNGLYVWSERTRRRSRSMGRRNVHVVGAPWGYLCRMEPGEPVERSGTLWYPFHGWESVEVIGDHRRLIDQIREVETEPVTVCLYWTEYRNRDLRSLYRRAGFRVICHGYRGYWWRDTDPGFLPRQLAELRRHRRVASNRPGSALLYGASVGCEVGVYGDPMVFSVEDFSTTGGFARIRREWPELDGPRVEPSVAGRIAHEELGLGALAHPVELNELLGWPAPAGPEGP
jgi:hypothetical protein